MLKYSESANNHLVFITTLLSNWYCYGLADGQILINALKYHPLLCSCFEESIQDLEEQTLETHTLKVMGNFQNLFGAKQTIFKDEKDYLVFLAMHDIGKPAAFAAGDRNLQHAKSLRIIDEVSMVLPVNAAVRMTIKILINEDIIGNYLNPFYAVPLKETVAVYHQICKRLDISAHNFWQTLTNYYQCDAAAYQNLRERVFIFDKNGNPQWHISGTRLQFRPAQELMFLALEKACIGDNGR